MKVGLRREDALFQSKWSVCVNRIVAVLMSIWPPSIIRDATRYSALVSLTHICNYIHDCVYNTL